MIRLIVMNHYGITWHDYATLDMAVYTYEYFILMGGYELFLVYADNGIDVTS